MLFLFCRVFNVFFVFCFFWGDVYYLNESLVLTRCVPCSTKCFRLFFSNIIGLPEHRNKRKSVLEIRKMYYFKIYTIGYCGTISSLITWSCQEPDSLEAMSGLGHLGCSVTGCLTPARHTATGASFFSIVRSWLWLSSS